MNYKKNAIFVHFFILSLSSTYLSYIIIVPKKILSSVKNFFNNLEMDFTKVINQAIARSVNKCYAEEEAIRLPQTNWAFTPLIPPGCVPFLELYGLENGES